MRTGSGSARSRTGAGVAGRTGAGSAGRSGSGAASSRGGAGRVAGLAPFSAWDLVMDADDAVYSGGLLTSWPARVGVTPSVYPGYTPLDGGPEFNGHASVLWPASQAVMVYETTIKAGTFDCSCVTYVHDPDEDWVTGGRYQYALCCDSGIVGNVGHVTETLGSRPDVDDGNTNIAIFVGGAAGLWHAIGRAAYGRQVVSHVKRPDGIGVGWINGVQVGSYTRPPQTFTIGTARLGNNNIDTNPGTGLPYQLAGYQGAMSLLQASFGTIPTDAQLEQVHAHLMNAYGITDDEWVPDGGSLTLQIDTRGKLDNLTATPPSGLWRGGSSRITRWKNQSDFDVDVIGFDSGNQGPTEGTRIGGYCTAKLGSSRKLTCQGTVADFITATEYQVDAVIRVDSISTTRLSASASTETPAPYQCDTLVGDVTNAWWSVVAFMVGAQAYLGVTHFDNVGSGNARWKLASVPITIGEAGHLRVKFKSGTLSAQWNGGAVTSVSAGAIVGALTGTMGVARGWGASPSFTGDLCRLYVRAPALSDSDAASELAWMLEKHGLG